MLVYEANGRFLERDAEILRRLSHPSAGPIGAVSLADRQEVFRRVTLAWPAEGSALLQLAAVAHRLDDGLGERLADAPGQLLSWSTREPWTVEPDEAATLRLAALVRLEQIDYRSFAPEQDVSMVLRDALTDPEDHSTLAAMVTWKSLEHMGVTTPDQLLQTWRKRVAFFDLEWERWPPEYLDALGVRGSLQRFVAALTWAGQEQWRAHIEPADDAFRACTQRQDIPLALTRDAQPGGWWQYRVPTDAAAAPGWTWSISPDQYVARGRGRGLGTISDVWELADRPDGLRAMTDQELSRWAALCARQAEGAARLRRGRTWWTDQHERVAHELRRRAQHAAGLTD